MTIDTGTRATKPKQQSTKKQSFKKTPKRKSIPYIASNKLPSGKPAQETNSEDLVSSFVKINSNKKQTENKDTIDSSNFEDKHNLEKSNDIFEYIQKGNPKETQLQKLKKFLILQNDFLIQLLKNQDLNKYYSHAETIRNKALDVFNNTDMKITKSDESKNFLDYLLQYDNEKSKKLKCIELYEKSKMNSSSLRGQFKYFFQEIQFDKNIFKDFGNVGLENEQQYKDLVLLYCYEFLIPLVINEIKNSMIQKNKSFFSNQPQYTLPKEFSDNFKKKIDELKQKNVQIKTDFEKFIQSKKINEASSESKINKILTTLYVEENKKKLKESLKIKNLFLSGFLCLDIKNTFDYNNKILENMNNYINNKNDKNFLVLGGIIDQEDQDLSLFDEYENFCRKYIQDGLLTANNLVKSYFENNVEIKDLNKDNLIQYCLRRIANAFVSEKKPDIIFAGYYNYNKIFFPLYVVGAKLAQCNKIFILMNNQINFENKAADTIGSIQNLCLHLSEIQCKIIIGQYYSTYFNSTFEQFLNNENSFIEDYNSKTSYMTLLENINNGFYWLKTPSLIAKKLNAKAETSPEVKKIELWHQYLKNIIETKTVTYSIIIAKQLNDFLTTAQIQTISNQIENDNFKDFITNFKKDYNNLEANIKSLAAIK
jgi:hypothetical protein